MRFHLQKKRYEGVDVMSNEVRGCECDGYEPLN